MANRRTSSTATVDPFDTMWVESDPLGRDVVMSRQVVKAREAAGKHPFPPEHLETEEVRRVVTEPDFIEESISNAERNVYYKVSETEENPFARVVVDFGNCENRGIAISWSRYKHTAQSYSRIWTKEG